MKTIFIVPYFGKLPRYFDLYLLSCSYNTEFTWIFFTDDKTSYDYPDNVKVVYTSLIEIKKMFEEKLEMKISLDTAYKLCDYKVAYGFLFAEYIQDYDYWGYTDTDIIYGDLSKYINNKLISSKYEKIFNMGHLTLYKNNSYTKNIFRVKTEKSLDYEKVFTTSKFYAFDEWQGMVQKCIDLNIVEFQTDYYVADIMPERKRYETWPLKYNHKDQVFAWDNGKVYMIYLENNEIQKSEFGYIHFQKRSFKEICKANEIIDNKFLIAPFKFITGMDLNNKEIFNYNRLNKIQGIQYFANFYIKKVKKLLGQYLIPKMIVKNK
ncbi:DUF6625 family protein [Clostridium beijerinckii]|uniref:DUF6625 family protein n=1 Tax=Clostridium beijerinckii TaxID=1520 RepID=UPI00047ABE13|nr:DUF6625 family protein [Clostridium beijerinckii]